MKKTVILLPVICAFFNAMAQDIIVTNKGEEILAKVEEVGDIQIKYKVFSNLSGPVYSLPKSEIFMIKYENGSKDLFNTNNTPDSKKTDKITSSLSSDSNRQTKVQSKVELLECRGKNVRDRSGKVLSKYEVQRIFADTPDALSLYNRGLSSLKTAKPWGWISAGSLVAGLTFTIVGGLEYRNSESDKLPATAYVGFGFMGLSLVSVFPYGRNLGEGVVKINSAVNIYNMAAIKKQRNSDISLNFGVTQSGGVGFTLNFN